MSEHRNADEARMEPEEVEAHAEVILEHIASKNKTTAMLSMEIE